MVKPKNQMLPADRNRGQRFCTKPTRHDGIGEVDTGHSEIVDD